MHLRKLLIAFVISGLALAAEPIHWKAILASGYSSDGQEAPLANWDNAREGIRNRLLASGLKSSDISILSTDADLVGTEVDHIPIRAMSVEGLADALERLDLRPGDGLILFMTSHGSRGEGWVLEFDGDADGVVLSPSMLRDLLNKSVGDLPAVLWISSCFSGQFLDDKGIATPHRVVMTAARRDRSSFGCGAGTLMPEWDDSLIKVLAAGTSRKSWTTFATAVSDDIARKEAGTQERSRSYPQFAVGAQVDFGVF